MFEGCCSRWTCILLPELDRTKLIRVGQGQGQGAVLSEVSSRAKDLGVWRVRGVFRHNNWSHNAGSTWRHLKNSPNPTLKCSTVVNCMIMWRRDEYYDRGIPFFGENVFWRTRLLTPKSSEFRFFFFFFFCARFR